MTDPVRDTQADPVPRPPVDVVLPRAVSVGILKQFRPDLAIEDPVLSELAAELGDLSLALHLAGSFLKSNADISSGQPRGYLEALRRGGPSHGTPVERTFALNIAQLSPEDPADALALELLARAAWLAPGEPIPRDILLKTVGLTLDEARFRANTSLRRLVALGLLDAGEADTLVIHRLTAWLLQQREGAEDARTAVEQSLWAEARRLNKAGLSESLHTWQPHLRFVTERVCSQEDTNAAGLCTTLGYHLRMTGDLAGARPYYERALAIKEKLLGEEHPETARSLHNLGVLLRSQGDLAGARSCYERALAIREKAMGEEHPDTANTLSHLAALLEEQGDLAAARPYYERALAIQRKTLGPNHPDTAVSLSNLGLLLQNLGDFAGARRHFERALAVHEKHLGKQHLDTALSLSHLGVLLQIQGDLAGARPYFERALAIFETRLGPDHPDTKAAREGLEALENLQAEEEETKKKQSGWGAFLGRLDWLEEKARKLVHLEED